MDIKTKFLAVLFLLFCLLGGFFSAYVFAADVPSAWKQEWPKTDFSRSAIAFGEVISGGPPKDGIPAISNPKFINVAEEQSLGSHEPVIALEVNGEAKAYPLRILMWHEIANDEIAGTPVVVTYCPLCNASIVFDRRANGKILTFGVSGKLRHSDMIMYDRQTESWWQQYTGEGIVGDMLGVALARIPSRVMPFGLFKQSYSNGKVLIATDAHLRRYGENPYVKYDSATNPFLYLGRYDGPGQPLSYVVAVGDKAWFLSDLRKDGLIVHDDLYIRWQEGMNSALDTADIRQGRDIGFVTVQRKSGRDYQDVPYDVTFAFAFKAFHPDGIIYERE